MTLSFPYESPYGYWTPLASSEEECGYFSLSGHFLSRKFLKARPRIPLSDIQKAMTEMRAPPYLVLAHDRSVINFFSNQKG
jgi:hypothetical protein